MPSTCLSDRTGLAASLVQPALVQPAETGEGVGLHGCRYSRRGSVRRARRCDRVNRRRPRPVGLVPRKVGRRGRSSTAGPASSCLSPAPAPAFRRRGCGRRRTCASIAAVSGCSDAATAPTQSARVETSRSMPSRAKQALCRFSGKCIPYLPNTTSASRFGPGAIGWNGAGASLMLSHDRQETSSRTCWTTNQRAGSRSRLSVISSPSLRTVAATRAGGRRRVDDVGARQVLR